MTLLGLPCPRAGVAGCGQRFLWTLCSAYPSRWMGSPSGLWSQLMLSELR